VLHEAPTVLRSIRKGDIINFSYDGKDRWVLVLQPNWKSRMHALTLEALSHSMLTRISGLMFGQSPPVFYKTYLAQNKAVKDTNAYRMFEVRKIQSVKRILYDYGFNVVNPNTMMMFGGLSIVLGYDKSIVYADAYDMLNGFVLDRSKKGMYISEGPTIPTQILDYCRKAALPVNFRTWKIARSNNLQTEAEYVMAQESYLQRLLVTGGTFFADDEDFKVFKRIING
jgi:hypothetical protein